MKLLVVCENPLFAEVLGAALAGHDHFELTVTTPAAFASVVVTQAPDVIIVDESLGPARYEPLLVAAREQTVSHILLLNPADNRVCVLDSHRTVIQAMDDLCQAIGWRITQASIETTQVVDEPRENETATKEVEPALNPT